MNMIYLPTTFTAVSTTFSTVKPNSLNNIPAGADAPNSSIVMVAPSNHTYLC